MQLHIDMAITNAFPHSHEQDCHTRATFYTFLSQTKCYTDKTSSALEEQ